MSATSTRFPGPPLAAAEAIGLPASSVHPWTPGALKIDPSALTAERQSDQPARMVLVSAITPTPAGEGKTTTTIGLGDALVKIGKRACVALREPSLGPIFGIKGGGTGGGKAQLTPSNRINMHFTGDFHAITAAHNLIAALVDNHLHFSTDLSLDPRRLLWPRVLDMNDRALRQIIVGLGGKPHGMPRQGGFDITAASELMAILCLSNDPDDFRARVNRILLGFARDGSPVVAEQLASTGAVMSLVTDALMPNLVVTEGGTPAFVHGGPFANIAHGCNSVLATRTALRHADYVVTEAGFGFDLGAEKFFDIKCRSAELDPAAVVLVASIRALKLHGGRPLAELGTPDPDAVKAGLPNLEKHIESVRHFKDNLVIAINRFGTDSDAEIAVVQARCEELGVPVAVCTHFADGGDGAIDLAEKVAEAASKPSDRFTPLYDLTDPVPDKIRKVAQAMYGARDIAFTKEADKNLADVERLGYSELPVCIAKTPSSLSDNPKLRGRPRDFETTVREIQINAGAGFLVVLTGNVLRMPGLPRKPKAELFE